MASTTWLQYYAVKVSEGNSSTVAMVQGTQQTVLLDNVCKSHLENADRFRTTIAADKPATILVVPQTNQRIRLLHHGSLFSTRIRSRNCNRDWEPCIRYFEAIECPQSCRTYWINWWPAYIHSDETNDEDMFNVTSKAGFTALKAVDKRVTHSTTDQTTC
jgi:hypothetical protein